MAITVQERIDTKALLQRRRPAEPLRFAPSLLSEEGEERVVSQTLDARRVLADHVPDRYRHTVRYFGLLVVER